MKIGNIVLPFLGRSKERIKKESNVINQTILDHKKYFEGEEKHIRGVIGYVLFFVRGFFAVVSLMVIFMPFLFPILIVTLPPVYFLWDYKLGFED